MPDIIHQDVVIKGDQNIVVGKGDVIINPLPPAEVQNRADLGTLLKNVETTWIKGVLEKSVYNAVLLDLGKEIWADAIEHPWRMVLEEPDQSRQILPPEKKIKDIFDEANRLLLILGDPGSGKTTTLLQLARDLISEVKQDPAFTQPVPVIFNLSTWTNKQYPLDDWLIAELNSKYYVSKKLGRRWLEERRILPLLDGLDEVKPENRATCVTKINQLLVNYGLQRIVVCSRIKDYTSLDVRLAFYGAIFLQPLTPKQIDKYFERAGDKLTSLRATMQRDEALQSLAQSPLILNIMSLAYQDTYQDIEVLPHQAPGTVEVRRKHLFDTYVKRMFKRRVVADKPYNDQQTIHWLSWLARQMIRYHQSIFLLESLQPSWLDNRAQQWWYKLSVILIFGLIGGLFGGLIGGLFGGLIGGLLVGTMGGQMAEEITVVEVLSWSWTAFSRELSIGLGIGLVGLIGGPICGPLVGLLSWLRGELSGELIFALLVGLIGGLLVGLLVGPIVGLFVGTMGGLIGDEKIELRTIPNQGIWRSGKNAVIVGLIGGLIFGLIGGLFVGLIGGLFGGLTGGSMEEITVVEVLSWSWTAFSRGLIGGLIGGLLVGLTGGLGLYGGPAFIQHFALRFVLWGNNYCPWNYVRFLDYATEHIFLQKVGGGYIFIHRLLLEHFADMYETGKPAVE